MHACSSAMCRHRHAAEGGIHHAVHGATQPAEDVSSPHKQAPQGHLPCSRSSHCHGSGSSQSQQLRRPDSNTHKGRPRRFGRCSVHLSCWPTVNKSCSMTFILPIAACSCCRRISPLNAPSCHCSNHCSGSSSSQGLEFCRPDSAGNTRN